jgi:hypothetical protein
VLRSAAEKFEGVAVHAYQFGETLDGKPYFGHMPDAVWEEHPGGMFANRIGHIENVKMGKNQGGAEALVGTIRIATPEAGARLVAAERAGSMPQLSVDTTTRSQDAPDGSTRILEVVEAHSLDVVTAGAAGGYFDRRVAGLLQTPGGRQPSGTEEIEPMADAKDQEVIRTVAGLREKYPELLDQAVQEHQETARTAESIKALEAERDEAVKKAAEAEGRLEEVNTELATRKLEAEVDAFISEHKLGEVPAWFRQQLTTADADIRTAMAKDWSAKRTAEAVESEVTDHGSRPRRVEDSFLTSLDGYWGIGGDGKGTDSDGDIVVKIPRDAVTR